MELDILYLDKYIAACVKPVGMSSETEVPELLKEQLGGDIFCIHRLDKGVGGVILYARTKEAAGKMSALVSGREIKKEYLAVCEGIPENEQGLMQDLLFHDRFKNKSFIVSKQRKGVKDAELEYEVLKSSGDDSLVHVTLHTGRTHQIRVQFASRKLPLTGDNRYGSRKKQCDIGLFSFRMTFRHPMSGKTVTISAVPADTYPWTQYTDVIKKYSEE